MQEYLIYDTDSGGWQGTQQSFIISNTNEAVFLKSAGLTEDVNVYQMVGICESCAPSDVKWEMVYRDGVPLTIGPSNNGEWVVDPGKYALGDPTDPPEFSGDVNITAQKFKGVDTSLLGKSSPSEENPLPVEVAGNGCDMPLYVEMCNNVPVEVALANIGCLVDDDDQKIGVVILQTTIDEQTGNQSTKMVAYYEDGTVEDNYSGTWTTCSDDCSNDTSFLGVITDLNLLN